MASKLEYKKGSDIELALVAGIDGEIQDITNWVIKSSVATKTGSPVADFIVRKVDPTVGVYELIADTTSWPTGELVFDIKYTTDVGQDTITESGYITLLKAITK